MGLFDFLRNTKPKDGISLSIEGESDLSKSVEAKKNVSFLEGQVDKNKAVFSLETRALGVDRLYQKKGRLQDKDLKDISNYDAIIGLIVNTRANQAMSFGKRSSGKYDRGFILQEINPIQTSDLPNEQKNAEVRYRTALANRISEFVTHCGTTNPFVVDYVFKGSDSYFKKCSLADFLAAQTLNLLIFGRCATQVIRNKDGVPVMFRPLAVETIAPVIDQEDVTIDDSDDTQEQSKKDAKIYEQIEKGRRPTAYVQRIEGKNVAFFTEDELIMTYYRKQAFQDLDGYPLAPIEQAYYTVSMHFYAQQYLQNMFTKGLASKGIISLKTQEGGVVSPEQTEMFRKSFSNYVARNDNSATIPVVSGPIDVEFIELNATTKDMEFLNLYNKVISVLCGCFQISPQEIGFGSLDSGNSSLGDSSHQDQIVQGEERGLRQVVEILFSLLEEVVTQTFPESKNVFRFTAIGLGQNTKEADLAVYKEELQTSGTFGKIWADSERIEAFPFGGAVPSSPLFHSSVAQYMKMSEMRYYFFGEKDALDKPEYDFFLDPVKNEMYKAEKYGLSALQAEQAKLGLEAQKLQFQQQAAMMQQPQGQEQTQEEPPEEPSEEELKQSQMDEEKHQMEMEKAQQEMQIKQEQHEAELQNMSEENKLKTIEKAKELIESIKEKRSKTLEDLYKK